MNSQPKRIDPVYKFKDWVDPDKIGWHFVSSNPRAIRILEKNPDRIVWQYYLSRNENAIHLLEKNVDKIDWHALIQNKGANFLLEKYMHDLQKRANYCGSLSESWNIVDLVEKHPLYFGSLCLEWNTNPRVIPLLEQRKARGFRIDWISLARNPVGIELLERYEHEWAHSSEIWRTLCMNENALHILERNPDKIPWRYLSCYKHAIPLLEKNLDKVHWDNLSQNPGAMHLLERNPHRIDWPFLNCNRSSEAVALLAKNPDKINWTSLSTVPQAVDLIEKNLDKKHKFNWSGLGYCDHAYEIDYRYLEERCARFKEELLQKTINPARFEKYIAQGYDVEDIFNFF